MKKELLKCHIHPAIMKDIRTMGNGNMPAEVITALVQHAKHTGFNVFGIPEDKLDKNNKPNILDK